MIHRISLAEVLEQVSPPARTLDVSAVDDTAFIRICDVTENHAEDKHREVVEISVSLPSLIEALNLLAVDAERERLRPQDRQLTYETRLAGTRFTVAPVAPWSAVAARIDHVRYEPPPEEPKTEDRP
jgi:site-specific recombinase